VVIKAVLCAGSIDKTIDRAGGADLKDFGSFKKIE
jgi:hypothetical protein